MTVNILHGLPRGLVECQADELAAFLGGPSLIHIPGREEPALFVSVLLHGNETSGWSGVRQLLQETPCPARTMILFIGNVHAAESGLRLLPGQQDYNRIWRDAGGEEGHLAASVIRALHDQDLHAAVDLHNNTGRNPHYSVLTDLDPGCLGLACLFSDKAVHIQEPDTVLARIFRGRCPAVTLELGPVGDPACDKRAYHYLQALISQPGLPAPALNSLQLYRSLGRLHVLDDIEFSFVHEERATPLVLSDGMEAVNFKVLPPGTGFGSTEIPLNSSIRVLGPTHQDVTDEFLQQDDGRIITRRPLVPAMYTTDPAVIRQDCLCYFMEPIAI
jgi:succinylglutamate desuccinylase